MCHYINDLHKKNFSRAKSNLIIYIGIGKNSFSRTISNINMIIINSRPQFYKLKYIVL